MNQLQNLLHDGLIATGHVHKCAIIRRQDYALRASSHGFKPSQDEVEELTNCFKHLNSVREDGIEFEDKPYTAIRADKQSIYATHNKDGLVIVRTCVYVVVATYLEHMFPSVCVEAVEKLGEFLREKDQ
ncbi:PREDICTED: profilin-4-like [Priapulus caudatus]|uniref:Profilin n=1 Tax=Priapulus caudatus TaxID=37621 RepID=A0ABM1F2F3_PRICU|nr:PREDICTED: profilin-4-like [Priapulus caudatus]XP_014678624.1 PREDICTED: profilin-4-like [Priapulus caudatus]XP_014678625.1 PREDICTED: profilin-4-like [Priapulus caudatus]